jgi:hypothetical protein
LETLCGLADISDRALLGVSALHFTGSAPYFSGPKPLELFSDALFFTGSTALSAEPGLTPERRQSPFSPMRTNGLFLLGLSDDPSMPAMLMAILSLLLRIAAPFLSGHGLSVRHFPPLAWSQRNLRWS